MLCYALLLYMLQCCSCASDYVLLFYIVPLHPVLPIAGLTSAAGCWRLVIKVSKELDLIPDCDIYFPFTMFLFSLGMKSQLKPIVYIGWSNPSQAYGDCLVLRDVKRTFETAFAVA